MRTRLLLALSLAAPVALLPTFVGAQTVIPSPAAPGLPAGPVPAAPQPAERKLVLTFHPDATVTLSAQNVPVRDILAEWRRKCACTVVNAERLIGGASPVPLFFERADQAAVLDTLLRQAAGYTLTPQRVGVISPSRFETIYILATSTPVAGGYTAPSGPVSAPITTVGNPEDEIAPVRQLPFIQNGPGQVQPPQPQQQGQPPPQGQPQTQQPPPGARPAGNSPFVPIVPIGGSGAPTTPPATGRGGGGTR